MSKSKAKKPVLSDEERRARMAALTSDVAAINLLDGGTIPVAPPVVASPATVAAEPAAAPAPEETPTAAPPALKLEAQPAPAHQPVAGEPLPDARPAAPAVAATPEVLPEEVEEADGGGEGIPATAAAPAATPTGELDLTALFAPAADKKDTTLRITAAHQQFFSQLGVVLGNGASAPDIIHNILTQFRAQHEAALSRLVRRALTKQFR